MIQTAHSYLQKIVIDELTDDEVDGALAMIECCITMSNLYSQTKQYTKPKTVFPAFEMLNQSNPVVHLNFQEQANLSIKSHHQQRPVKQPKPVKQSRIKTDRPTQLPFIGLSTTDLPKYISEETFWTYLILKRQETTNPFWNNPDEIKTWLTNKGKVFT